MREIGPSHTGKVAPAWWLRPFPNSLFNGFHYPTTERSNPVIAPTTAHCVYFEDCYEVADSDLHKAVEAQGFIALAAIKSRVEADMPDDGHAVVLAWLDVLATMLMCQGHPTRDCTDMVLYSDGSPVFRLVPDGTVAEVEARDYLDNCDDDFDYIGEIAEHLFTATLNTGYRVEVTDPPVEEHREPSHLVRLLRERYRAAPVANVAATTGGEGHGEAE